MRINTEIYTFIDDVELSKILDSNKQLKTFVEMEVDRMKDEGLIKSCGCSGGCCSSCGKKSESPDASYMTAALASIFNYYIPDDIKNALHMVSSTAVEDCSKE